MQKKYLQKSKGKSALTRVKHVRAPLPATFPELPDELWLNIVTWLSLHELNALRLSNFFFYSLIKDFWRDLLFARFPSTRLWSNRTSDAEASDNSKNQFEIKPENIPPFFTGQTVLPIPESFIPSWHAHYLLRNQRQPKLQLHTKELNTNELRLLNEVKKYSNYDAESQLQILKKVSKLINNPFYTNSIDFVCYLLSLIPPTDRTRLLTKGMEVAIGRRDLAFFDCMLALGGDIENIRFTQFDKHKDFDFLIPLFERGVNIFSEHLLSELDEQDSINIMMNPKFARFRSQIVSSSFPLLKKFAHFYNNSNLILEHPYLQLAFYLFLTALVLVGIAAAAVGLFYMPTALLFLPAVWNKVILSCVIGGLSLIATWSVFKVAQLGFYKIPEYKRQQDIEQAIDASENDASEPDDSQEEIGSSDQVLVTAPQPMR